MPVFIDEEGKNTTIKQMHLRTVKEEEDSGSATNKMKNRQIQSVASQQYSITTKQRLMKDAKQLQVIHKRNALTNQHPWVS